MLLQYRHRRGTYAMSGDPAVPELARKAGMGMILLLLIFAGGTFILNALGVGNSVQRDGAVLDPESRGTVQIIFNEGETRPAQNRVSVFAGEGVETLASANAHLTYFDGTFLRLAEQTQLFIDESSKGREESELALRLSKGDVWIAVPTQAAYSGSIVRTLETPSITFTLPAETVAYASLHSIAVFASDGPGVTVALRRGGGEIVVGEGQEFRIPEEGDIGDDLYEYRSPLTAKTLQSTFIAESRELWKSSTNIAAGRDEDPPLTGQLLTVTQPADGAVVETATLQMEGRVSGEVQTVRINGHDAVLDRSSLRFSQELLVPETTEFAIDVKALASDGTVLAEKRLTVRRTIELFESPAITEPAKAGETYRTREEEVVLRGTAPAGAAAILVNDYQLRLFDPEKGTWSYVASLRLENLQPGRNTFNVTAIDAAGRRSAAATLTIIQGEEPTDGTTSSVNPALLPQNASLTPGILSVTAPTPGVAHTETGTGFLLEGSTSAQTDAIWVNDYRLQLYRPGKTFWNYIASAQFGNLKRGTNVYIIVARNAKGEILDRLEYRVEFKPE